MCSSSCPSPTFSLERSPRCLLKKWVPKSRGIKWSEEWRDCRSRLHQIHILPSMNCQSLLFIFQILSFSYLNSYFFHTLYHKFYFFSFLSGPSLHKLSTLKRLQARQSKLDEKIFWSSFLSAVIQNLTLSPCHLCWTKWCSLKKAFVWPSCTWEPLLMLLESRSTSSNQFHVTLLSFVQIDFSFHLEPFCIEVANAQWSWPCRNIVGTREMNSLLAKDFNICGIWRSPFFLQGSIIIL